MNNNDIDENVLKKGKEGIKENLLSAFDEFADAYADETWQIINELTKLRAENAELRARLDKAIELPCKVGDTVYCISPPFNDNVDKGEIVCVRATKWMDKYDFCITVKGNQPLIYVEDDVIEPLGTYYREDINETWFTDRAKAEKKLAELKGEKE